MGAETNGPLELTEQTARRNQWVTFSGREHPYIKLLGKESSRKKHDVDVWPPHAHLYLRNTRAYIHTNTYTFSIYIGI